jgi:very-short-patch-repair endonuclease
LNSKNNINPRELFKGSEKKCIFNCDKCNSEFESKLYNVLTGYWCPYCKKKTEAKLQEFLRTEFTDCKSQVRFNWCRYSGTNNIMPVDFVLIEKKIIIELDGEQHFNQISNWESPEYVQKKDVEKIELALQNRYSIIHLSQIDVWKDTYDWRNILKEEIQTISEQSPLCIFIQTHDLYVQHISQITIHNYKIRNIKL